MKYYILLIAFLLFSFTLLKKDVYPKELIGTWEFVELLDSNNQHIDTLRGADWFSVPAGPKWIINVNGTYSREFTSKNIDNGTWTYNKHKKEIVLKLYWKKPYNEIALQAAKMGLSKKDKNGDYYDLISEKIIEVTNTKLVILDKENRQRVFKKTSGQ